MAGTEASINGFHDFPKNSFQSWGNYFQALMEIPHRLLDRIMSRSLDQTELVEVKAESQHGMKKTLTWWDLIWFGMGAVIGSGIFVLTGLETQSHAGPAVVLSYVISGISASLSVFCYTEFAVEIPVAGKSFLILQFFPPLKMIKNLVIMSIVWSSGLYTTDHFIFTIKADPSTRSIRPLSNVPKWKGAQNFEKERIVEIKTESFEFLLSMTIWYNILFAVNPISKNLQLIKMSHFLF